MSVTATLRTFTCATLVLAAAAAPALGQTKIKAGVAAFSEALAPVYAADKKGYFADAGIEVEMLNFKGGGATVQALVGGSIEACLCAADHVLRLSARGMPAQILAGFDEHHSYALLADGDAPYESLEDLKGKRIAITSPGSLTDNTLRYMIGQAGLDPDMDFTIIAGGNSQSRRAAMQTDQVDAAMFINNDVVDLMQTPGAYKIVEDFREMSYPAFTWIVLKSWIEENPDTAKALAGALGKAIADLKADPEFAKEIIAEMYPNFSPELVAAIAESMTTRMPEGGIVSQASFDTINDLLPTMDTSLSPVPLDEAFDPSLLQ
ncbi:ABC transporter substrate-binding protein [Acuticoccus mangrovi]|uniref:ABC transporter substrate-binding protein n=1 Tax=Acuticoccus mangrovi TaxID=2796142 RepID=A0A934IL54_9HYPH|nr:ABC transporter substrate-binding protein [Acuticoccus mangrovi]MBJ3776986.1 ABC transporter substrate-binding protein [Acuticoccus mangrovi]